MVNLFAEIVIGFVHYFLFIAISGFTHSTQFIPFNHLKIQIRIKYLIHMLDMFFCNLLFF